MALHEFYFSRTEAASSSINQQMGDVSFGGFLPERVFLWAYGPYRLSGRKRFPNKDTWQRLGSTKTLGLDNEN